VAGWGKAVLVTAGVALFAGCANTVDLPWQRHVDKIVVGTIKRAGTFEFYITGGGSVMAAGQDLFVIDPVDAPGDLVEFLGGSEECPPDPPGETVYLVHLTWSEFSDKKRLRMVACTPIERETSHGLGNWPAKRADEPPP
jgi:hypothetical protein